VLNAAFKGSAAIVADGASDLTLAGFEIRGNRTELKSDWYLPLKEAAFADFYPDNGIVVRNSDRVVVRGVHFSRIRTFPLIVNASSNVTIDAVKIEDCGTLNQAGRNNTSGGILLEEGVSHFEVRGSTISRITGNAIWTHSYSRSPRASDGAIRGNTITTVGRDAIQVGHATRIRVENNSGAELGFPVEYVDVESHGVAVALDTAGNVDHSVYAHSHFTDVNGQCIDLDGFHDGEVMGNSCINKKPIGTYPALHYGIVFGNNDPAADSSGISVTGNILQGFAYGAVFLIGSRNRIENNQFLDINLAHCGSTPVSARCNYALDQPDLLRSGIYLSNNGGRPVVTKDNVIRANVIRGFGMKAHCMAAAKGVALPPNSNNCSE
jgi:parallel beta helix pectate lyase-like protein